MKYNLAEMNALDIYLSNLTLEEYSMVKEDVGNRFSKPMDLLSWDFFMEDFDKRLVNLKKENDKEKLLFFAKKFHWKNNLSIAFNKNDYDALILTDINQNILWVNDGFTTMTGYSKNFAINKTPRFLQGKETSLQTKKRIKEKIIHNKPFKETIINHRKDKSTYKCEVKIYPLYSDKTTHFIAFEKEVI